METLVLCVFCINEVLQRALQMTLTKNRFSINYETFVLLCLYYLPVHNVY